jgi:hypothetical protein
MSKGAPSNLPLMLDLINAGTHSIKVKKWVNKPNNSDETTPKPSKAQYSSGDCVHPRDAYARSRSKVFISGSAIRCNIGISSGEVDSSLTFGLYKKC